MGRVALTPFPIIPSGLVDFVVRRPPTRKAAHAVTTLLDQLRQRRDTARQSAEQILTRASDEQRDLTPDELAEHRQQVTAEREAADEADRVRDEQIAELRATAARRTCLLYTSPSPRDRS